MKNTALANELGKLLKGYSYPNNAFVKFNSPTAKCLYVKLLYTLHELQEKTPLTNKELYTMTLGDKVKFCTCGRPSSWGVLGCMVGAGLVARENVKYYKITPKGVKYLNTLRKYNVI